MDELSAKNIAKIAEGLTHAILILMDRGILPGFMPNKELDADQIRSGIEAAIRGMVTKVAEE